MNEVVGSLNPLEIATLDGLISILQQRISPESVGRRQTQMPHSRPVTKTYSAYNQVRECPDVRNRDRILITDGQASHHGGEVL